ncbi:MULTISPECIES: hypothetical protein [unclassified Pseudonocardia]|uniref:hypothetical protein n=1 Tax=unclassified Pseudonocardia TaxID=2619320 RepID=UPI0011AE2B28|nr:MULTISPECIES: hypothetical protein [unclassified Pseudonocardia]
MTALTVAGFTGTVLWSYMVLPDEAMTAFLAETAPTPAPTIEVEQRRLGWRLLIHRADDVLGEIEIDHPLQGTTRIAWLEVTPAAQAQGWDEPCYEPASSARTTPGPGVRCSTSTTTTQAVHVTAPRQPRCTAEPDSPTWTASTPFTAAEPDRRYDRTALGEQLCPS